MITEAFWKAGFVSGRVEVFYNDHWGTVPRQKLGYGSPSQRTAVASTLVCRKGLGFRV